MFCLELSYWKDECLPVYSVYSLSFFLLEKNAYSFTNLPHRRMLLLFGPSVQFSHSVASNSLWSHELQHARPPCPSPMLGVYSNSCLLSWWCHPTISSSFFPFSSCLQPFPASQSFPMSQFFASVGQSVRVSASASVLPMNI